MNRPALLPDKHIRFGQSILALAGWVRDRLDSPRTLDELWSLLRREPRLGEPPFDHLVFAVDLLYAIGQITLDDGGRIRKCHAAD